MTTKTIKTGWPAICFLLAIVSGTAVWQPQAKAQNIRLAEDHPDVYVVVPGDTLWDIAGRFLEQPWQWPEVWELNPGIENPHLIYPGDRLRLEYVDGQPRIVRDRDREGRPTVRLSPQMRSLSREDAIETIPRAVIDNFLIDNIIMPLDAYEAAPYIVSGTEDSLILGAGDEVFARGDWPAGVNSWDIYRSGTVWYHPESGELLGNELRRLGEARIVAREGGDDIRRVHIRRSREELKPGDRLMIRQTAALDTHFFPRAPATAIQGSIISLLGEDSLASQYDSVLIDTGAEAGLRNGDLLDVYLGDRRVPDPVSGEQLSLPRQQAARLMIYRTFDRLSYGIILSSTRPVSTGYEVRSP